MNKRQFVIKNNHFTGTSYSSNEITEAIEQHHEKQGEQLLAFDPAKIERDQFGNIITAVPKPSKDQLIQKLRDKLNRKRDEIATEGFIFQGKRIQTRPLDVDKINSAAIAAQSALLNKQPFAIKWTTADNSELDLDAQGMLQLQSAMVVAGNELHQKSLKAKQDLQSKTISQLGKIKADDIFKEN